MHQPDDPAGPPGAAADPRADRPAPGVPHLTRAELEGQLDYIRAAPPDEGVLRLIVSRPAVNVRETLESGELHEAHGLVGDSWRARLGRRRAEPHRDTQLNVMGVRTIAAIARQEARWPLAGDQLYVDLDLSEENLPAGTQLSIGSAVIEVTPEPHTGCAKFVSRFGVDAMRFVNSAAGRALRLRGLNARVVRNGTVRVGDRVRKLRQAEPPDSGRRR